MTADAVEEIPGDGPVLITCEHATERMPPGWSWPEEDAWLIGTHWAYDLGAREVTVELAHALGARAVLARYSRLLVDPNRDERSETLFRDRAEDRPVHLNTTHLDAAERRRRVERLLRPYHARLSRSVRGSRASTLVAIHSFTPVYEGEVRELEIGVLYDHDEALARRAAEALDGAGLRVALNEPYSGKDGMMYSIDRHARASGRAGIELEIRQDLATDPDFRADLVALLARLFG